LKLLDKNFPEKIKGYVALLASAFAFSLMTVCVKLLSGRYPVAELVLIRALISLFITRVMLAKAKVSPWGKNKKLLFIRGLLGTSALFCIFEAIAKLPLASATIIQYTYPTFTALAAWLLLKEGIGLRIVFAIAIGWLGIILVVQPDWISSNPIQLPSTYVFIALTGAFFTALAYICVRKLSKKEHPLVIVHYFPLVSVPITIPFIFKQGVLPIGIDWIWLLGIGIFTQLGQLWITQGLSLIKAAQASSINYVQVLFSMFWGIVLFEENPDNWTIIGGLLILIATLISLSKKVKSPIKI